jgi:hypothetical protein
MATITDHSPALETETEALEFARRVLRIEAIALERVRDRLTVAIGRAAEAIHGCRGSVIVTGMGKAGLVGQKLAATLADPDTAAVRRGADLDHRTREQFPGSGVGYLRGTRTHRGSLSARPGPHCEHDRSDGSRRCRCTLGQQVARLLG